MNRYAESLNYYRTLNKRAAGHGAVFFGADWMSEIPVAELARDGGIESAVYNRSLKGLVVDDAEQVLEDCVCALLPDKVFISIGKTILKALTLRVRISEKSTNGFYMQYILNAIVKYIFSLL